MPGPREPATIFASVHGHHTADRRKSTHKTRFQRIGLAFPRRHAGTAAVRTQRSWNCEHLRHQRDRTLYLMQMGDPRCRTPVSGERVRGGCGSRTTEAGRPGNPTGNAGPLCTPVSPVIWPDLSGDPVKIPPKGADHDRSLRAAALCAAARPARGRGGHAASAVYGRSRISRRSTTCPVSAERGRILRLIHGRLLRQDKPEPFEGPDWEAAKRSAEELAEPRARDAAPGAATAVALAGEGADVACAAGGASQLAQTATGHTRPVAPHGSGWPVAGLTPLSRSGRLAASLGAARDSRNGGGPRCWAGWSLG